MGLIDVVIVADKPLHLGQGDLPARVAFNDVALEGEIDALADQRMAERVLKKYKTSKTATEISAFLYFYMWRFLFPGLSKGPLAPPIL